MPTNNETGLTAIAHSARRIEPRGRAARAPATEEKPPLERDGREKKTSLNLDIGLWDCVLETAHVLSKRSRGSGGGRVAIVELIEAAITAFHELSLEEQLARVRKLRESRRRPTLRFLSRQPHPE